MLELTPLQPEDQVAIIAPAGSMANERIEAGIVALQAAGLNPVVFDQAYLQTGRYAGTPAQRVAALHEAFENPAIKAILCTRGGFGSVELLDLLDLDLIAENPKPLIGYSDISTLLVALNQRLGLPTLHGPMITDASYATRTPESYAYLAKLLSGQPIQPDQFAPTSTARVLRAGEVTAPLLGGNLHVLAALCGSEDQPVFNGKIALFEDVQEPLYRLKRNLVQLSRSGAFFGLKGVILGDMVDVAEDGYGCSLDELVLDHFAKHHPTIPIIADYPAGHGPARVTLPFGPAFTLKADTSGAISLTHAPLFA
jgi:muramoyltetrapeptide carboxypeptidase